jgi:hypothetical protein
MCNVVLLSLFGDYGNILFFRSFHGISFTFNWIAVRKAGNVFLEGQPRQVLLFDRVMGISMNSSKAIKDSF